MLTVCNILHRSSILSEPVEDVLMQLIKGFEGFLKSQKTESDVISKYSDTSLKKIMQDTATQSQVKRYTNHPITYSGKLSRDVLKFHCFVSIYQRKLSP